MRTRFPLLYECGEGFDALGTEGDLVRHCTTCKLDVVDFRALTESEQDWYVALADEAGIGICATQDIRSERSCEEHPEAERPRRPGSRGGLRAPKPSKGTPAEEVARAEMSAILNEARARRQRGS